MQVRASLRLGVVFLVKFHMEKGPTPGKWSFPPQVASQGEEAVLRVEKWIAIRADNLDRIDNVKDKFREMGSIATNIEEIFISGNPLETGQTMANDISGKAATLHMQLWAGTKMQIHVKIPPIKKTIILDVKDWDTIHDIKVLVQDKEAVSPDQQIIIYAGMVLEDGQSLASYNIQTGSTLYAIFRPCDKMQIFVTRKNGGNIRLEVRARYTIQDIRTAISSMWGDLEEQEVLLHAGKVLDNDQSLAYYGIKDNSSLMLVCRKMQIFVKTQGKSIAFEVEVCDGIEDVKTRIHEKLRIPLSNIRLTFEGRLLENGQSLMDYRIEKGCTLRMFLVADANCVTAAHMLKTA